MILRAQKQHKLIKYLNTKFPSFWFFGNCCSQPSSRWGLARCIDRSRDYAWSIPVNRYTKTNNWILMHKLILKNEILRKKKKTRMCNLLKKLRLCTTGISNYAHIDVPSQVNALVSKFVNTTQKHEKDCSLDILVTKNSWSNTINQLVEKIRSVSHSLNFI